MAILPSPASPPPLPIRCVAVSWRPQSNENLPLPPPEGRPGESFQRKCFGLGGDVKETKDQEQKREQEQGQDVVVEAGSQGSDWTAAANSAPPSQSDWAGGVAGAFNSAPAPVLLSLSSNQAPKLHIIGGQREDVEPHASSGKFESLDP